MTEKINVLVYNKEQKDKLYKNVVDEGVMSLLPELRKDYRWKLKVSKNAHSCF